MSQKSLKFFWAIIIVMKFRSWIGRHGWIVDCENCWSTQMHILIWHVIKYIICENKTPLKICKEHFVHRWRGGGYFYTQTVLLSFMPIKCRMCVFKTRWEDRILNLSISLEIQPFDAGIIFFLILAHTVYKMWIIQEPNMLELWNKLHF